VRASTVDHGVVRTTEDQTVAAGHSVGVDPARWQAGLDELLGRVAGRFGRVEPRRRARAFVLGLLADLPRKNCWTLSEHAGDATPDGLQHLLAGAVWDHDAVRDDIRDYLVEHLGDPGAVLVVDETGDLKKGSHTVGVQRQYTGTAGKVDNAQVAVYLTCATAAGHGVIDRELYLPQGWIDDPVRLKAAGVPDQVGFATKPELARVMLERALDAEVPAGWVTADEVYGASPALRGWLETRQLPYVLAVKCTEPLPPASGPTASAARLAARVPPEGWLGISAGHGAKGRRWYGWSRLPLALLVPVDHPGHAGRRLSGRGRGHRARPPPTTVGAHPLDLQPDPAPVRGPGLPACQRSRARLRWSWWRRRQQARARACHYRRQAAQQP
jgi:DDE superfamily endonuclease